MSDAAAAKLVRQFRQMLLWPLQLRPLREGDQIQRHWEVLQSQARTTRGARSIDEFAGAPDNSRTTLQRAGDVPAVRPTVPLWRRKRIRATANRRCACSVATTSRAVRVVLPEARRRSTLSIAHIDLYFFFDIDVDDAERRDLRERPVARRRAGHAVPIRPRVSRRMGYAMARPCIRCIWSNGLHRTARCSRSPTRAIATNSSRLSANIACRASLRIGNFCCSRSCRISPVHRRCNPLSPDRVLPHAGDGVSRARQPTHAVTPRLRAAWTRHRGRRRRHRYPTPNTTSPISNAVIVTTASGRKVATASTAATRAICVVATASSVVGDARWPFFTEHRHWRARTVPASALPDISDRAFPESLAADVLGSARPRARASGGRQSRSQ